MYTIICETAPNGKEIHEVRGVKDNIFCSENPTEELWCLV